jgi:SAM-dependent methyltransferase
MMVHNRVEFILPHVQGPEVLDVGCAAHVPEPGSPYWLHGRLLEKFPSVIGLDLNQENMDKLKAQGFQNLVVGNAEDIQLNAKFNTIVAGELIEHLSNPGAFLSSARKHLAPGGKIVLTTPYPFGLLGVLYAALKFPKTCQNLEHTCWFCPQTFQELSRRAGLRIAHWELFPMYGEGDPSFAYGVFVGLIRAFHWLLPKRLSCSSMLIILESVN